MNKIILISLLIFLIKLGYAQELKKLTAETQFRIVNLNNQSYVPNLKFRYFINTNSALRTTINYNSTTSKKEINEVDGEGVGSVEKSNSLFDFSLGYERHFKDGNVSPYLGGELKLSTGNINEFGSRTDSVVFIPNFNYTSKVPVFGFGIHLFTGVDIALSTNLYLGTELGLSYQSLQQRRGTFNTKDASALTDADVTTDISAITNQSFKLINVGVVRLGWRF